MTEVGNSGLEESLKAAAADIKDSVAKYGSVHAIVLQKLQAYIDLLVQTDAPQLNIDKWKERAEGVRRSLELFPGSDAAVGGAKSRNAGVTAEKNHDGVYSLDDADDDESISYDALEQFAAKNQSSAGGDYSTKAAKSKMDAAAEVNADVAAHGAAHRAVSGATDVAAQGTADVAAHGTAHETAHGAASGTTGGTNERTTGGAESFDGNTIYLFDIRGLHVACAFQNGVYTPDGKNIGRYQADFDVFVDKRGNYMGQIYDNNRFIRDPHFKYATFNFGDKGNEGDRPGWGRQPDTNPTTPPDWYEDVHLPKGDRI